MIKICFCGDVMLGRLVNNVLERDNFKYVWGSTLKIWKKADFRIINLECVISSKGKKWKPFKKVFHFRASLKAINCLKVAKIDCVCLANNHTLDYGKEAFLEMLNILKINKIGYCGAGKNFEEAKRPFEKKVRNNLIKIFNFTDNMPEWKANKNNAGINFIRIDEKSAEDILKYSGNEDSIKILSLHWGPNMLRYPLQNHIQFAEKLIKSFKIIFGHSSHLFQPIQVFGNNVCIYDCGDFIDDYYVDPFLRNDETFLFLAYFKNSFLKKLKLFPCLISNMQVNLAKGELAKVICKKMVEISKIFGTKFEFKKNLTIKF